MRIFAPLLLLGLAHPVAALQASEFVALDPGTQWEFNWTDDSGDTGTETRTVASGQVSIGGQLTNVILATFGNDNIFSDASGVGVVRLVDDGDSQTYTNDPLLVLPPTFTVGSSTNSSGTLSAVIDGASGSLPYSATATVAAMEALTVPAGTFESYRVEISISSSGNVSGIGFVQISADFTWWFARGIGTIKEVEDSTLVAPGETSTGNETSVLVSTSADSDGDTIGAAFDNCPNQANTDQADLDGDAEGDVCDDDIDGDGESNSDEQAAGTDPLDGTSNVANRARAIIVIPNTLLLD